MPFNKVKTRIAPSPTGNLHLGTVRTALYNMLFARHHDGEFLFRLEDTDKERSKEDYTQEIIHGFKWVGVKWDGDMIRQSERHSNYQKYIDQLLAEGKAYKCFVTPAELEEMRKLQRENKQPEGYDNRGRKLSQAERDALEQEGKNFVVRLNLGEDREIKWTDSIRGDMSVNTKNLGGDLVIQKSSGQVLYNFAVAIDDFEMEVSHVFRGEDHLTNTAKQIAVFEALGFDVPTYGHLPLIFTADKQKLSKRKHGDIAGVLKYQNEGYLPESLANYLIATSYTNLPNKEAIDKIEDPKARKEALAKEEEIFTMEKIYPSFDIHRVSKSPAIYDIKKLNWFNSHYIKELSFDELMVQLKSFLKYDLTKYSREDQELLIESILGNLNKFDEINENINYFFEEPPALDEKLKQFVVDGQDALKELHNRFDQLDFSNHSQMKDLINKIGEDLSLKGKKLFFPIRIATSGRNHGPDLGVVFYLLGKEITKSRLEQSLI